MSKNKKTDVSAWKDAFLGTLIQMHDLLGWDFIGEDGDMSFIEREAFNEDSNT